MKQFKLYTIFLFSIAFTLFSLTMRAQTNGSESPSLFGFYSYFNSLQNLSSPSDLFITGNASYTAEGVQLTPAALTNFGGMFINGRSITSVNGLQVEFEYEMSGGTTYGGAYGDGLCFFLYDGSITSPVIGSNGAGLGYSYNRANNIWPSQRKPGLTGAYLGVGLDLFGNFKGRRFQGDSRVNGITGVTYSDATNQVTIRGSKGANINSGIGLGSGYTGYPVLITRTTTSNATNSGFAINSLGNYSAISNTLSSTFSLRNNGGYRKLYLSLVPNFVTATTTDGFYVSVGIKTDINGTAIKVIDNFLYKNATVYKENAMPNVTDYDNVETIGTDQTYTLNSSVPSTLKVGFSASTGAASQKQVIKNVKMVLPYSAVANNDSAQYDYNTPVTFNVLNNDIAYSGVINIVTPPTGNSSNIDPATFSFEKTSYDPATYDYTIYRTKTTAQGQWSFNQLTGKVTFTPAANFTGTATMTYTIKGYSTYDGSGNIIQPYGDTAYRSTPATITVTFNNIKCLIANKMVTARTK